jgi:hypothetical protein
MAPQKHDALAFRLAEVLRLLHSGERLTRPQLADRFAVNERTVYCDPIFGFSNPPGFSKSCAMSLLTTCID